MDKIEELLHFEDINKEMLFMAKSGEQIANCLEIQNRINKEKESLYIN